MNKDISTPVKRADVSEKLMGTACYIGDMELEDMLYAKTLRSSEPRARLVSITYPEMPSGYFVVDKRDVPGKNIIKMILEDQPFFAEDVVNYIGEPIALIVGKDKAVLRELIAKTSIEYERLKPVFSIEEGLEADTPIYGECNYFAEYRLKKGNLKEARSRAKYICEETYETGYQEQFYLEPQGVIAEYKDGKAVIYGSIQCPYYVKNAVIECLGFAPEMVRIVQATTGGAFGGKEDYPSLLAGQAACAAIKANKPVCLLLERNEDIEVTTKRHPSRIKLKSYIDENYKLTGMEADIVLDAGAYAGLSGVVLQRAMFAAAGVYNIENLKVKGKAIATNKAVSGAFRGFGSPQAFFAIEMHMEHAAKTLGIDPLAFKLRNILKQGDKSTTGGIFREKILLSEMVDRVIQMSGYEEKKKLKNANEYKRRGIGLSMFFHGCGFTGNGERDHIKGRARLVKNEEDHIEILIANVEMGQGAQTTMRKIAAAALDIELNKVFFQNPDTDRVPDSGPTVASRTTVIVGKLVYDAAMELKTKWETGKRQEAEVQYQYPEGYQWDNDSFEGDAYTCYSWGVNAVEVEVDPITLESEIKGVWAVYDIGKSIDDRLVRGQIDGGIVQGLGYAGMEVMENRQGRFIQRSSTDYIIPTAKDIPMIQSELMCEPYSDGPFGAKGLGELTFVGSPIAYALAMEDALEMRINNIPVRPEFLMEVADDDKRN
ncbi:MAG: xanthine dehydrogenase family protein [Clostridia bacterium]|jgi:CO/xanthine dehydrogenase Mo-binding subunit|nr:xanthine dehydrogenase family protein [Clostridia bacterium]